MNNFMNGKLYTTFASGTCYFFETDRVCRSGGDARLHSLSKKGYATIDAHLLEMMKTVQIAKPTLR